MTKTICTLLFYLFYLGSIAQPGLEKHVCNIDGTSINQDKIKSNAELSKSDELQQYLTDIKYLFEQPHARYTLMDIKNYNIAVAHIQLIGHDYARVISINKDYYARRLSKTVNKRALFIWILAHEVTHHLNGDLHYDMQGIVANNFKKEILADERAGYAVGMLTNVDIEFFDQELPGILSENTKSATHPIIKYRIYAARAGWLQAKLKELERINSCSKIYKKEKLPEKELFGRYYNDYYNGSVFIKYQNKDLYFGNCYNGLKKGNGILFSNDSVSLAGIYLGKWEKDQMNGVGAFLWTNGNIYHGNWKNSQRNGKGNMLWYNGNKYTGDWKDGLMEGKGVFLWENGDQYKGDWKKGKRNGYGIYIYSNGTKYRGQWINDKKHGDGFLYNGEKVIKAGCWQNDKYVGTECIPNH